jgi:hypothetical protein
MMDDSKLKQDLNSPGDHFLLIRDGQMALCNMMEAHFEYMPLTRDAIQLLVYELQVMALRSPLAESLTADCGTIEA